MKRKNKRRKNPATTNTAPVGESISSNTLVLGAILVGGAYLLLSGKKEELPKPPPATLSGIEPEDDPGSAVKPPVVPPPAPPPPPPPVAPPPRAPLVATRGLEAPTDVVARVVGNNEYKGALPFYFQSLPFLYGETDELPTGELESDKAALINAAVRRVFEGAGQTWDGLVSSDAAIALRQALSAKPLKRSIPYSFTPEQAGIIYAIAAFVDKQAVNPFAPERSIQP